MKTILQIVLITSGLMVSANSSFAQFTGGEGDGYAAAEASFTLSGTSGETLLKKINAFPNPVKQGHPVSIELTNSEQAFNVDLCLSDLSGKPVANPEALVIKGHKVFLSTGHLSTGIYILKLTTEEREEVMKIVVY